MFHTATEKETYRSNYMKIVANLFIREHIIQFHSVGSRLDTCCLETVELSNPVTVRQVSAAGEVNSKILTHSQRNSRVRRLSRSNNNKAYILGVFSFNIFQQRKVIRIKN